MAVAAEAAEAVGADEKIGYLADFLFFKSNTICTQISAAKHFFLRNKKAMSINKQVGILAYKDCLTMKSFPLHDSGGVL
jgi:hypothetical protein